jgi:DNA-binding response OmpR family regulator
VAGGGGIQTVEARTVRFQAEPPGAARADRSVVVIVDRQDVDNRLAADLDGQPLEIHGARDPAEALLIVGRVSPDLLIVAPVRGRLDTGVLVEILREREPQLPVVLAVPVSDGALPARVASHEPAAVIHHPYSAELVLRLVQFFAPSGRPLPVAPLPIDLGRLRIARSTPEITLDGVRHVLPQREYLLLRYLAEHLGKVVSHAEITQAVWGATTPQTTNTIAVHIMRLRRRLAAREEGTRWIRAIRGIGYQLTVPTSSGRTSEDHEHARGAIRSLSGRR